MFNFAEINESLRRHREERKEDEDQKALDLISRGIDLYDESFWQNLMNLSGDIDGFAALLGINKQKIATWRGKIKKYLTKYYDSNDSFETSPKKRRLIRTKDFEE